MFKFTINRSYGRLRQVACSLVTFSVLSFAVLQDTAIAETNSEKAMKQNLDFIGSVFESAYAPKEWKQKFSGWTVAQTIEDIKQRINSQTSIKEYQLLLIEFFKSTKDYHVGYSFVSSESSSLPFTVKEAEGKYVIVHVERDKLPLSSFPFSEGDLLVTFDGRPTQEVVAELSTLIGHNVKVTDDALAAYMLTRRNASRGLPTPKGSVTIEVQSKLNLSKKAYQLAWNYNPEKIANPRLDVLGTNTSKSFRLQSSGSFGLIDRENAFKDLNVQMISPLAMELSKLSLAQQSLLLTGTTASKGNQNLNPYGIGLRKSFLPKLGKVISESPDTDFFHSYIYKNADGKLIGVVRIASYSPSIDANLAAEQFATLVNRLEDTTDALIIDQVNNPGGSVFYLYALASMLSEQPLYTPQHRMSLNQEDVSRAVVLADTISRSTTEEVIKAIGGEKGVIHGYPVDYNMIQFIKNYSHFIISEWEKGKTLTDPFYIFGADKINPSRTAKYTKPILVLVNELDFSGGDFFPAILQDNKRVTVMGTRTAGAGGYVKGLSYPNLFGLAGFSFTGSLAERIDQNPIENLGVTPDIELPFTLNDLQNGYGDYSKKVNEQISSMIQ